MNIRKIIREEIESYLSEDYPVSFKMEEFKEITSFKKRIDYCETHLTKIGSGSARIVYKIDDEKVLKLAKNAKGVSQNEVEINHGNDYYLRDLGVIAEVFDNEENNFWLEMQLAGKCTVSKFKQITGLSFENYSMYLRHYKTNVIGNSRGGYKVTISDEIITLCEENTFVNAMVEFIGNYDIPIGDLQRISSYGIVKKDGNENIVLIDFGLNDDVYKNHYSR